VLSCTTIGWLQTETFIVSALRALDLVLGIFWGFGLCLEVLVVKYVNSRLSFLDELSSLRKLVESRFPSVNSRQFDDILSKLAHYHYNKKNLIVLGLERDVYDYLVSKSYNPFTIYRWLLLERVPEEVRFQIRKGELNQKEALRKAFRIKQDKKDIAGESLKKIGLELIKRM
jgi:hypothetical protein